MKEDLVANKHLTVALVLYWTYIHVLLYSGTFDVTSGASQGVTSQFLLKDGVWAISLSCNAVTVLIVALLSFKRDVLYFDVFSVFSGPAVMCLGICLTAAGSTFQGYGWGVVALIGVGCTGIGLGLVISYFGFLLSRITVRAVIVSISVAMMGNAVTSFCLTAVDPWLVYVILGLCPWVMGECLRRSARVELDGTMPRMIASVQPLSTNIRSLLVPLVMLAFVVGFSLGFIHSIAFAPSDWSIEKYGFFLAAVFAAGFLLLFVGDYAKKGTVLLLFVSIGIVAASFLFLAAPQLNSMLVMAVHGLGFYFFNALFWMLCADYAQKSQTITKVFIASYAIYQVSQLIGTVVGAKCFSMAFAQSVAPLVSAGMVYLLLIVATAFLLKMGRLRSSAGTKYLEDFRVEACDAVSEQYGLTPREREIVMLLSKGRDRAFIAEACSISIETVKTHTNRIYAKLDIHSRQELLTIIEEHLEEQKGSSGAVPRKGLRMK